MFKSNDRKNRELIADLLLLVAKPENSFFEIEKLRHILSRITNWKLVISLAVQNGLIPLLHEKLNLHQLNYLIPSEILNLLKKRFLTSTKHLLSIEAGLIKIHSAFLSKGIDFIVLKGLTHSYNLYEEPNLRPMFDLDILVKEKDIEQALYAVLELGFKPEKRIKENYLLRNISINQHIPALSFNDCAIELHKSLFPLYNQISITETELWLQCTIQKINNIEVNTLCPEDNLLYLCHHANEHLKGGFVKLIWYLDIALLIKKYNESINWERVLEIGKPININESLVKAAAIVDEINNNNNFRERFPANNKIRIQTLKRIRKIIGYNFKNRKLQFIQKFISTKNTWNKLIYLRYRIFPTTEMMKLEFKLTRDYQLFFYYPYKLFQFLFSFFLLLIKSIKKT